MKYKSKYSRHASRFSLHKNNSQSRTKKNFLTELSNNESSNESLPLVTELPDIAGSIETCKNYVDMKYQVQLTNPIPSYKATSLHPIKTLRKKKRNVPNTTRQSPVNFDSVEKQLAYLKKSPIVRSKQNLNP